MKTLFAIGLLIVVSLGGALYVMYGTVDPCGILKKEISTQVRKQGSKEEQGLYLIFGGLVERAIDSLTPLQCVEKAYEIKTQGYKKALSNFKY